MFPALSIRASDFHCPDGRVLSLLKAEGTIPIHYQVGRVCVVVASCVIIDLGRCRRRMHTFSPAGVAATTPNQQPRTH